MGSSEKDGASCILWCEKGYFGSDQRVACSDTRESMNCHNLSRARLL